MKKGLLLIGFLFSASVLLAQTETISLSQEQKLEELLELNAKLIKNNKIGRRYKIQLGSFTSMDKAEKLMKDFQEDFKGVPVQMQYESPNYKIWAGDFTSKLAADRFFLKIKREYRSAFVFRPSL